MSCTEESDRIQIEIDSSINLLNHYEERFRQYEHSFFKREIQRHKTKLEKYKRKYPEYFI